jgi:N2-acetyl-L-2,4-diaminobutanoate deacetylase
MDTRISCTIDLDGDGFRRGFLVVPHSRDDSAWGSIRVPITVARGGPGPTVLLTAGIHGDEYEGPIALMRLADQLERVRGRVILLPTANHPAVLAATRTSPIDRLNMNRVFPGRADGTVTETLAHYVLDHLVARADAVIDLHSGGRTLDFVPSVVMHDLPDPDRHARTRVALLAFGAPLALVLTELDAAGMLDTAVEEQGRLFLSTELGGGGTARPGAIAMALRGLRNVLRHLGVLQGEPEPPERPSRLVHTPDGCFTVAAHAGMVEPLLGLGEAVAAGQPLARVHFFEDIGRAPVTYTAVRDGLLYARHFPGLVKRGDCLAVVACDL